MLKCKKLWKNLFTATCVLTMTACANSTAPLVASKPSADLLQPCAELPELENVTAKAVLLWSVQAVHLYHNCKARYGALVKAIE
ncbi:hypothetical protein [Kingella kingae]|uniref:hypothetical protein n=4 Tax=Kingella kingae TaxID=504 RepID=UPI000305F91C